MPVTPRAALERFRRSARGPLIYAHRGACAEHLENTMPAFEAAFAAGADGIELDVRASADGGVVVFHDRTLERIGGRPEQVRQLTTRALSAIALKDGGRIPILDDVLDRAAGTDMRLNVEIKGDAGGRAHLTTLVSSLLKRRSPKERERVIVSSFRPEVLTLLRALGAGVPTGFLFDAANTGWRRAALLQAVGQFPAVHPEAKLVVPARLKRWSERGWLVNAWTVDEPTELARLAALGVDGIITNDPRRARAVLFADR